MSNKPTPVTEDIYKYIIETFTPRNEFFEKLKEDADAQNIPEISISPDQGTFLQFLIRATGAENILEIGTLAGYSAFMMAESLPENGLITTVEINSKHAEFARDKTIEAGLSNKVRVINDSAESFLKNYTPKKEIDLAFIDADKTGYIEYFELIDKFLKKGGIFIADNALAFGDIVNPAPEDSEEEVQAIRDFNKYVKNRADYSVCLLTIGDGFLLAVKNY